MALARTFEPLRERKKKTMTFLNTEIRLKEHYRDKSPSRLVMQDVELMALFRYPQRLSFVMLEGAHSDTELYPPGRTVSRIVLDFLSHAPLDVFTPWRVAEITAIKAARCHNAPPSVHGESAVEIALTLHTVNQAVSEVRLIGGKGVNLATLPFSSPKFCRMDRADGQSLVIDYAGRTVVRNGHQLAHFSPEYDDANRHFLADVLSSGRPAVGIRLEEALALHYLLFGLVRLIDASPELPLFPLDSHWESIMACAKCYTLQSPHIVHHAEESRPRSR